MARAGLALGALDRPLAPVQAAGIDTAAGLTAQDRGGGLTTTQKVLEVPLRWASPAPQAVYSTSTQPRVRCTAFCHPA